jgi:hypothetical protein
MRNDPLRRCATTLCEVNYAIKWQANEHFGLETEMIGIIRFAAWWKCQSGPCLLSGPGDMLFKLADFHYCSGHGPTVAAAQKSHLGRVKALVVG